MQLEKTAKGQMSWTLQPHEVDWIKTAQHTHTDRELAEKMGITYRNMCHLKRKYQIKKQEQKAWTEKEVKFLLENYTTMGDREIGKKLGRTHKSIRKKRTYLNLNRTEEQLIKLRSRLGREAQKKMKAKPSHYLQEGEITYQEHSGYYMIRTKTELVHWHRWAWEQANGKIEDGYIVYFLDGDKGNLSLDNLGYRKKKSGKNIDKHYVCQWNWRQKRKRSYYFAQGYELFQTTYGSVWLNMKWKSHQRARIRLLGINDRAERGCPLMKK